jgi:creatinine amidohydrolase
MGESVLWQELTNVELEQARDAGSLVLVPLGAVEQHGPHLPVDTDVSIAWALAREVARRLGSTVVAPPIWWGYSSSHMSFPSTISLRPQTLLALLEDVCGSIASHGFTKIAIVSSHATNRPFGQIVVREFAARHGLVILYMHYVDFCRKAFADGRVSAIGGEMHGGEFETALQLHLNSHLVRMERATTDMVDPKRHFGISSAGRDLVDLGNVALGYDIGKLFPTGVMGDATVATAELGAEIFETAVTGLAQALDEYRTWDYGDSGAPTVKLDPESWHSRD